MGSIEYWRLYQSGQFVHFSAVREATESQWADKLKQVTISHLGRFTNVEWDAVPGYLSLVNLVNNVTEYFEFAARICQAGVYDGVLDVAISLRGAKGFLLTTEWDRMWSQYCPVPSNDLSKKWEVESEALVAGSAEHSLKAITWLCESFGWMSPNLDALRKDQQKLFSGRI